MFTWLCQNKIDSHELAKTVEKYYSDFVCELRAESEINARAISSKLSGRGSSARRCRCIFTFSPSVARCHKYPRPACVANNE